MGQVELINGLAAQLRERESRLLQVGQVGVQHLAGVGIGNNQFVQTGVEGEPVILDFSRYSCQPGHFNVWRDCRKNCGQCRFGVHW